MRKGLRDILLGRRAEKSAERLLKRSGYRMLERNYQCRYGEIDLIAKDAQSLVFVEVRYRKNRSFGGAAISITRQKRLRITRTARHYLQCHPEFADDPARFDVITIEGDGTDQIEWFQNAFEAESLY